MSYCSTEWRDVIGYENSYEVSSYGDIRSKKRNVCLSPSKHRDGYLKVALYKNGNRKTHQLHRLVAIAFIPNPRENPVVNHLNGIKDDNRIENLEWVTVSENTKHAYDTGLAVGHNGGNNRIVFKINPNTMDIIEEYNSITEASKNNNTYRRKISTAIKNKELLFGYLWEEE